MLPAASKLSNQFTVRRAGQSVDLVRVSCPAGTVDCVVRRARVAFQARQNLNPVTARAVISRTTIPAGETAVIRANVPGAVFRQLTRQKTGSVTTSVRVVGPGAALEADRRSGLRRR